jgi:hypothetical protein
MNPLSDPCRRLVIVCGAVMALAACGSADDEQASGASGAPVTPPLLAPLPPASAPVVPPVVVLSACDTYASSGTASAATAKAFWVSQPLKPNQTAVVSAGNIGSDTKVQVAQLPDCATSDPLETRVNVLAWQDQGVVKASTSMLNFIVPGSYTQGVFGYRMVTASGTSATYYVNKPDLWSVQGDQGSTASPGGWLQVHGTALALDGGTQTPAAALVGNGRIVARLATIAGDTRNNGYRQRFAVPASVPAGTYDLWVSNGSGGVSGWTNFADMQGYAPDVSGAHPVNSVTVAVPGISAGLQQGKVFNVADAAGADWNTRFANALNSAQSAGGGTVKFPAGTLALANPLVVPAGVTLAGAGKDVTVLQFANPGYYVQSTGGSIEDLTIKSPADAGVCVYLQDVETPLHLRRIACRFPNLAATGPTTNNIPPSNGTGVYDVSGSNLEVSDSDFDVRTPFYFRGIHHINYTRIENNTLRWRDADVWFMGTLHDTIFDGNRVTMAGTFEGNGWSASTNPNPGTWFAGFGYKNNRDLYYANNSFVQEDPTPVNGAIGITFDGQAGSFFNYAVASSGTTVTLVANPDPCNCSYSDISPGGVVQVIKGTGAGQWRNLTGWGDVAHGDYTITVDKAWDVPLDGTSLVSISNFLGRTLFIGNDFAAKPLLQTYFGTHDIVWANNLLGGNNGQGLIQWTGDWSSASQPGWHYQVLDNKVVHAMTMDTYQAFSGKIDGAAPMLRGQIFRGNQVTTPSAGYSIGPGTRNAGFLIEDNVGLSGLKYIQADYGGIPFDGVVRHNTTSSGAAIGRNLVAPGVVSVFD